MSGFPADARRDLPLAVVAAATTWVTMLSWRGFSTVWGTYLGPLLLMALVVSVGGVLLRAAPVSRRVALVLHVLIVAVVVWLMLGGSLLAPVASAHHIADSVANAFTTADTYIPPVPANVPGIAPIMIPCGALSLLVVDLLACWLRRVPLAGLPLLAVYCVPMSLLGKGVSVVVFLVAAAGFLLMMFLQESAHITRWGRPLGGSGASGDTHGFGVSTGASKTSATTVGSVAVALAIVLPLLIPTLHLDGLGLFGPGGSGNGVKVINPITDMRRNLNRGKDVPLLDVKTDDPNPSYLRIAVLTQFNGVEWSTGSRQIISNQLASGIVPPEQGLTDAVPFHSYNYQVTATHDFISRWLPTEFPVTDVVANGDWHYDTSTMDFIAGNDSTSTAGLTWTMTAIKPQLSNYSMIHSLSAVPAIQEPYTALPSTLPPLVSKLADHVTAGATNRFQQAVMLQDWFRTHFRYSLKTAAGDGNQALLTFLTRGKGGRVGYCEQFASAFAVMARTLSMPARVAVGFLQPTRAANGDWVYSAHDLHAWPEVFFAGSGWVRFEPTPASRASAVPAYTVGQISKPGAGKTNQAPGGKVTDQPSTSPSTQKPHNQTQTGTSSASTPLPWPAIVGTLVALVVLAGLALVPGAVRRSRRARRLAGDAETAWAELRDSAVDLGVSWPSGRSPHETGHHLAAWFGPDPDGPPLVRPPRGRGLAPRAEEALGRVVLALERVRYARYADDVPGALADDVRTCIAALEHGSTSAALRRARWFPRSLVGGARRRAAEQASRDRQPEAVAAGGVVDHVG